MTSISCAQSRFGFCDILNNQGLRKGYQTRPSGNNPFFAFIYSRSLKPHPIIVYNPRNLIQLRLFARPLILQMKLPVVGTIHPDI